MLSQIFEGDNFSYLGGGGGGGWLLFFSEGLMFGILR